jgi:hypothetical protein
MSWDIRLASVQGNQSLAYGVLDEVGRVVDVQLGHDAGAVDLDGLEADVQLGDDFPAGAPAGHELEDLFLPGG